MQNELETILRSVFPWVAVPEDKGATEGNHRLTALTGSILTVLLTLVFLTGLLMDAWWHVHYVIGFVLIPVVALKLASTGYRMMRYYTGNPRYRAAGPPDLLPRMLAPLLALSVVTALVTGVLLFAQRARGGTLSTLHTDAAVASALLVGVHLLTYVPDALATLTREFRSRFARPVAIRMAIVAIALALGIVLAIVTYNSGVWPAQPFDRGQGMGPVHVPHAAVTRGAELT